MTGRPLPMVVLALAISVLAGAAVGGLSQMTAVSEVDPRPSIPPLVTPTPAATATPEPSPSATAVPTSVPTATPFAGGEVWLYTLIEGDSLSGLAIRFGTTEGELLELNPAFADNPDLVQAGSQMTMPCTPIAAAEDRC